MSKGCKGTERGGCYRSLYVSKDYGFTWTNLISYIAQFDWVHSLARNQAKGAYSTLVLYRPVSRAYSAV